MRYRSSTKRKKSGKERRMPHSSQTTEFFASHAFCSLIPITLDFQSFLHLFQVLLGATSSKIESLAFSLVPTSIQTTLGSSTKFILRLFSISGGSILTEHYLPTSLSAYNSSIPSTTPSERFGQTYRTLNSNGGSIWSLASSPLGIYLAIGCDDGFVRLISIRDDKFDHVNMSEMGRKDSSGKMDERNVVDKFEKVKGRILSLAWGNPIKIGSSQKKENPKKQTKKEKKIRVSGSDDESSDEESDSSSDSDDDDDEDSDDPTLNYKESLILAGSSRSCGLVFKVSTGRLLTKLIVPKLSKNSFGKRNNNTGNLGSSLVWSVLILPSGTFVLGDSNSRVTFFDSKTFTLIPGAEFRCHDKNSDVLSLCSSQDGKTVYSGGTDMKVSEISWMETNNNQDDGKGQGQGQDGKWSHIISRRLHSHDIRSIAMDPPLNLFEQSRNKTNLPASKSKSKESKLLPILVSGGTDFSLILTPASPPNKINLMASNRNKKDHNKVPNSISYFNSVSDSQSTLFSKSIQRKCSFVPPTIGRNGSSTGGKVVSIAKKVGWILVKRENKIGIWDLGSNSSRNVESVYEKMARKEEEDDEDQEDQDEASGSENHWRKIIEIEVKTHTNLDSCEISDDGNWLIISDLYESKLFRLIKLPRNPNSEEDSEEFDLKPSKVSTFGKIFTSSASTTTSSSAPAATCFKFDKDSQKLILSTRWDSKIFVIGLPRSNEKMEKDSFRILKIWDSHVSRFGSETLQEGKENGDGRAIASNGKVNGHPNGNGHLASEDEDDDASSNQVNGFSSSSRTNFNSSPSGTNPLISLMALSKDCKYLFTSDMSKRSYLFNLESLEFVKSLPSTQLPLSDACFLPSFSNNQDEDQICLLSPNGKLNFHNVSSSKSTDSKLIEQRRNLLEVEIKKRLGLFRDSCSTVFWISNSKSLNKNDTLVISGSSFILTCKFLGFSSASSTSELNSSTSGAKKRKENQDLSSTSNGIEAESNKDKEWNIKYTNKYQSLLHLSEMARDEKSEGLKELLVIERPFFDVARALPPGYDSGSKYGT